VGLRDPDRLTDLEDIGQPDAQQRGVRDIGMSDDESRALPSSIETLRRAAGDF
jgi:hypothetical protein